MDKSHIKSQIAMRPVEFPTDLIKRESSLPIGNGKIVTIPEIKRCDKYSHMENIVNELISQGVDRKRILLKD